MKGWEEDDGRGREGMGSRKRGRKVRGVGERGC